MGFWDEWESASSYRALESQDQGHLDLAWWPVAKGVGRRYAAKILRIEGPDRRIEVGMIQKVEDIDAGIQADVLMGKGKRSADAGVERGEARTRNFIARRRAKAVFAQQIWIGVGARIDPGLHRPYMVGGEPSL